MASGTSARINIHGELRYRTRLMELEAAARFAKCLGGNARFAEVEITQSPRAKSEKRWLVEFAPANEARRERLRDEQQNERAKRAEEQGFTFVLDTDTAQPFLWCHSHQSGEVYEVDCQGRSCSCADFTYRCKPNNMACKHILASRAAAARGEIRSW